MGFKRVIGIDEVGRGCWAGPLVLAAAQLDLRHYDETQHIQNVRDSKKLSSKTRREIVLFAETTRIQVAYANAAAELITEIGLKASIEKALANLVSEMEVDEKTYLLLDRSLKLPKTLAAESAEITKGDDKIYSIALASIHAKEKRDEYMRSIHPRFPVYGFDKNVGYGTVQHRNAIELHGVSPEHRLSFRPLQKYR
ncbi:MAG: ribonuclease HII [Candidatus Dojkabacteria bacterium]